MSLYAIVTKDKQVCVSSVQELNNYIQAYPSCAYRKIPDESQAQKMFSILREQLLTEKEYKKKAKWKIATLLAEPVLQDGVLNITVYTTKVGSICVTPLDGMTTSFSKDRIFISMPLDMKALTPKIVIAIGSMLKKLTRFYPIIIKLPNKELYNQFFTEAVEARTALRGENIYVTVWEGKDECQE